MPHEPHYHPDHDASSEEYIVTDVRQRRSRAQPRAIYLNGDLAFHLSEDICMKHGLYRGARLDEEAIRRIRSEEDIFQAKQTALRMATRRLRSVKELRRKLADKGFDQPTIDVAIDFLNHYEILDDTRFARAFVEDQLIRRPLGKNRLELELRRKGVDKETIGATLSRIGDEKEYDLAMAAAEKKFSRMRATDPQKRERSMANFLAGRGFGWEVISRVMRELRAKEREEPDEPEE